MIEKLVSTPKKHYEEAKNMLKKKDLTGFMENIGIAKGLSNNDKVLLAEITFLKVKGLYELNQYKKVIESVPEALEYNEGAEAFRIKKLSGISKGYLGEVEQAVEIFEELLTETEDTSLLVRIYINIAWVYLTVDKSKECLEETKKYLGLANEHFETLPNILKRKIYNNYGVYYFYKEEYEKAIEIINDSFKYSEEKDLPKLYNNLAEIHLKLDKGGAVEVVKEYTEKAEIIATEYDDKLEIGKAFYVKAMAELEDDELFTSLDTLYLSFEYFKEAGAYSYAFDCLVKINELMSNYKVEYLKTMKESMHKKLEGTQYYKL
ncbi:MAG: hypothetical protein KAX49_02710 [Halanaerobiales bacterium]|nr:hypothetical protein [Halanaerobiales bacterium]